MPKLPDADAAGRAHREQMMAHYSRLQAFSADGLRWIEQIERAHHEFYRALLGALEHSSNPDDYEMYQVLDNQYVKRLASLQAASERLIEAGAHIRRAIVHPGDPLAHLKNVNWEKK